MAAWDPTIIFTFLEGGWGKGRKQTYPCFRTHPISRIQHVTSQFTQGLVPWLYWVWRMQSSLHGHLPDWNARGYFSKEKKEKDNRWFAVLLHVALYSHPSAFILLPRETESPSFLRWHFSMCACAPTHFITIWTEHMFSELSMFISLCVSDNGHFPYNCHLSHLISLKPKLFHRSLFTVFNK